MRVSNPGMTKAEKVDEITSWVMNDEGIYNAHLRAKTSVMRQREVAEMAAEMAGIRDQAAIGRAAKELVQTFKETNPYVGDAVQSASARKKQQHEKERQQKYGYPAPPRKSNSHRNPPLDENSARVRRMMNPKNY